MSWFLDFVPVVGTIKNTVEAIGCIADGDMKGAFSKGTQAVIGGVLDVATFGAASSVGKLAMKGVVKEIGKGIAKQSGKVATKTVMANIAARGVSKIVFDSNSVSNREAGGTFHFPTTISHEELAKKKHDRQKPDRNGKEKEPASRGEHVINNNVLNVYRDIVNSFVQDVLGDNLEDMIDSVRLSPNSNVLQSIYQPVPEHIANFIRNIMKVHPTESYLDVNSENYGREIELLRNVIVSYMEAINNGLDDTTNFDSLPGFERNVRDTVLEFLAGRYYVDEVALKLWLQKHKKERFEEAEKEVERMFRDLIYDDGNDKVIVWVKELRKAKQAKRR